MIEEQGRVIALMGGHARVATRRRSACGHCEVSGACGTSLLERFFGRHPAELVALNPIDAQVGDEVAVGIGEQDLLRAAVAAYLVPVLALIAGALIGETLGGSHAEIASLLGAMIGLTLAFLWLRGYSVASVQCPGRQPVILRRLGSTSVAVPAAAGRLGAVGEPPQ